MNLKLEDMKLKSGIKLNTYIIGVIGEKLNI